MRELERDNPENATPGAPAPFARLAIVGRGRAGGAIARAASGAGITVSRIAHREPEGAKDADTVLLCVPDAAIADTAQALADSGVRPAFAGHVSGATGLDALEPLAATGAKTFSLHPLQTLPDGEADLGGAACAVDATSAAGLGTARSLAADLGMSPFQIDARNRAAYHAAASIASNFLVTLEESAASLLAKTGITDARAVLAPLVERSAANWAARGGAALTGPIARGDVATIEQHREALRELAPELLPMYDAMEERTRAVTGAAA